MKKLLFAQDIAQLLDWPTQRARRWLMNNGGRKIGGRWVITPTLVRDRFPGVFMGIDEKESES